MINVSNKVEFPSKRFDLQVPRTLWRLVVGIATGIVAISGAISKLAGIPLLTFSLVANGVLIAAVLVLALGVARSNTATASAEGRASRAPATIAAAIPEARALADFLAKTLFSPGTLPLIEENRDDAHFVSLFERDFRIAGTDIAQEDTFKGTNVGDKPTAGLRLITYGGRFVSFDRLRATAHQRLDGEAKPLHINLELDTERLKVATIQFANPLGPGERFTVTYAEEWDGAMEYGIDAVFYTPTLYLRQVGGIQSRIEFTHPDVIENIRAYYYDMVRDVCGLTTSQPKEVSADDGEGPSYEWTLTAPRSNLYFVMFQREGEDQP